ncbi:MAG: aminoglycoside 6-adenylyltransferase [Anaerolineae bacterium]|nr:aminoglycoside 6-adenylyltransferase [Anaerolineae bacterium]
MIHQQYTVHQDRNTVAEVFEPVVGAISAWAEKTPNVLAAVVLGSMANPGDKTDDFSDLDLTLVVNDLQPFLDDAAWFAPFAPYHTSYRESADIGQGIMDKVILDSYRMFDLSIFSMADLQGWMRASTDSKQASQGFFRSSLLVLVDKIGIVHALTHDTDIDAIMYASDQPPSYAEYKTVVATFWYYMLRSLKHLHRGDWWRTAMTCNRELRGPLLQMVTWQAKVINGWDYETLYEGRYIQRWATPMVQDALPATYPQFNAISLRDALLATAELFNRLDVQVAPGLGFAHPDPGVQSILEHVMGKLRSFEG